MSEYTRAEGLRRMRERGLYRLRALGRMRQALDETRASAENVAKAIESYHENVKREVPPSKH